MNFLETFSIIILLVIGKVSTHCDFFQTLELDIIHTIASPRYPQNYFRGTDCLWTAEAPLGYKVFLSCELSLPTTLLCMDRILVSTSGEENFVDATEYCGGVAFNEISTNTRMTIALITGWLTRGGRFKCLLKAVKSDCSCGELNRGKIVGGVETQINEYPSMAGVVDISERRIFCGATIISNTYALSAAHCVEGRNFKSIGLLIGEHDISKGNETSYSALLKIAAFVQHPRFDNATNANDIALIRTQTAMTFTPGVQPVCLPFKFRSETFVNSDVQVLGWGSIEFAGPQSKVLKHVTLEIVDYGNCTSDQICTFGENKDSCQSDSGGPLFYIENSMIFLVGIVSYGMACASTQPSVNTRVTSYLDWIQQNTETTIYCEL